MIVAMVRARGTRIGGKIYGLERGCQGRPCCPSVRTPMRLVWPAALAPASSPWRFRFRFRRRRAQSGTALQRRRRLCPV